MDKYYYLDGSVLNYEDDRRTLHRLNEPAIEYEDGGKEWWQNGKRHRLNGPAVEWANGCKVWFQNNKYHRTNGPAMEYSNGDKEWWYNDILHRLDGPALEHVNGEKAWYINGDEFSKKKFEKQILIMKLSGLLNG